MCGISVCITASKTAAVALERFENMNNIIRHRGPDDEGYLVIGHDNEAVPLYGKDSQVSSSIASLPYTPHNNIDTYKNENNIKLVLGFRRLSILDTSTAGHQPMSYLENRYWIVLNGEIYNYLEIKQELIQKGYGFQSETDTEVVLAAYDCWGKDCLNMFNGMWAFVIYDRAKDELFISRDRFGVKPLYYYFDSNQLLFASEIKQFIAYGDLDIKPNREKIIKDFSFDTKEYTHETAFTNVYKFPKASYAYISLDGQTVTDFKFIRYYELPHANLSRELFSETLAREYAKKYYDLLKDAVRIRLRSDVSIGTCLSGGLDSSSIVYIANQILKENFAKKNQKTFSLVFVKKAEKYCDESIFIDKLVTDLDLDGHKIELTYKDVIHEYENMVFAMDNPQHSTLMSYMFTYKLVKNNFTVVTLDGQGADELQAGYLPYFIHYFTNHGFKGIYKDFFSSFKMKGASKYVIMGMFLNLVRTVGLSAVGRYILKIAGIVRDPWINLNEALNKDFEENLETLFHYGDRGSMWNSVESRFPMMDYRIVEFWMRLPENYKIAKGYTKYIARLALDGKLPDEITWRKDKKGWEMPQREWIKAGLNNKMIDCISKSYFLKSLHLDFNANNFKLPNKNHRFWKKPIKLYNLALWHRTFFENKTISPKI